MVDALTIPARGEHKAAPRADRPTLRNAGPTQAVPSLIATLHARWETAGREYDLIDARTTVTPNDHRDHFALEMVQKAKYAELDRIADVILSQTPANRQDAVLLAFHIHLRFDAATGGGIDASVFKEEDAVMLAAATERLVAAMIADAIPNPDALGQSFAQSTQLIRRNNAIRAGEEGGA